MIAVPGDIEASTISGMIADEAAIGMINAKTTAVRVIPVPGKKVGDTVEFGGLLGYAPIMDVSHASSAAMISRGGTIPAPVHSLKINDNVKDRTCLVKLTINGLFFIIK